MKRKIMLLLLTMTLTMGLLSGCGSMLKTQTDTQNAPEDVQEMTQAEETAADEPLAEDIVVRVAAMKGPTTMGLVKMWQDSEEGTAKGNYEFNMMTGADEIMPLMIKSEMDIALLPANAAANLYQKSKGAITVIDINTLGVLYVVSANASVSSVADLKGKTIYLTGKGTTPDYALQYLLAQNSIDLREVTLEYKSEAVEVAAILKENPDSIGLLPQPFVTAALAQNESLKIVLDINAEWEALNDGNGLVTGVTVVRTAFLEEQPEAVDLFMEEHEASAEFANTNVEEAAELVAARGIVEKAAIAAKAMPGCNITYMEGEEMKTALSSYLTTLFEQNPEFIGGAMPGDDFYTIR